MVPNVAPGYAAWIKIADRIVPLVRLMPLESAR
jgi:hypothetical protein